MEGNVKEGIQKELEESKRKLIMPSRINKIRVKCLDKLENYEFLGNLLSKDNEPVTFYGLAETNIEALHKTQEFLKRWEDHQIAPHYVLMEIMKNPIHNQLFYESSGKKVTSTIAIMENKELKLGLKPVTKLEDGEIIIDKYLDGIFEVEDIEGSINTIDTFKMWPTYNSDLMTEEMKREFQVFKPKEDGAYLVTMDFCNDGRTVFLSTQNPLYGRSCSYGCFNIPIVKEVDKNMIKDYDFDNM